MKYMGGKYYQSKSIVPYLARHQGQDVTFWEPFCGAFNILPRLLKIASFEKYECSDAFQAIITLNKAVQSGWLPDWDYKVTLKERNLYKEHDLQHDPMYAVYCTGCSFGAKPWGAFIGDQIRNKTTCTHYQSAINSLKRKQSYMIDNVYFSCRDYRSIQPKPLDVIYCDPPYKGFENVGSKEGFDHCEFWEQVRTWCKMGCWVYVSERTAPNDFTAIDRFEHNIKGFQISNGKEHQKAKNKEALYVWSKQLSRLEESNTAQEWEQMELL